MENPQYINNRSNGISLDKLASTVYDAGWFVIFNGLGQVIPATGGVPLVGLATENIATTDPDYAVTRPTTILESLHNDQVSVTVTTGSATAAMVGSPFDVDAGNPGGIDVSAPGTDLTIVAVIDATHVICKIN